MVAALVRAEGLCLAQVAGAGVGLGKTLIGLRDMDRLLAACPLPDPAAGTGKPFLVAAPTQAILDAWPQEARKFGLDYLLEQITFTT